MHWYDGWQMEYTKHEMKASDEYFTRAELIS